MTADEPVATTPNRKGFRAWLRRMLLGLPEAVPPQIADRRTLPAHCKGGGFDFSVVVTLIWTGSADTGSESLREEVEDHKAAVWGLIRMEVWEVARCYPPNQAFDLEKKLEERLSCRAQEWRAARNGRGGTRWEVRVRVKPDDEVGALQREFWTAQLRQEAQMSFSYEQAKQLTCLAKKWREFLAAVNIDVSHPDQKPAPVLAAHLARLAMKPDEAADTMDRLAGDLEKGREKLLQAVENAVKGTQKVDTYEFLTSYESALVQLLKHVGERPVELGANARDGSGS